MNIGLIGYGKMGQTIESIALDRGHSIVARVDENNPGELNTFNNLKVDVAVEFTIPDAAPENIKICVDQKIPVVCGTTGWNSRIRDVIDYCKQNDGTLLYSSNFSIGVNVFFEVNRKLAQIMNRLPEYTPRMSETHHIRKKDAPSGTAITLAEDIISSIERIPDWKLGDAGNGELPIQSIREGDVPGTHAIVYESDIDMISIEHRAKNRTGFGLGAVLASEWVVGKKGFFTMKDFLDL